MKVKEIIEQERTIMSEMEDLIHSIKKIRSSPSDKNNEWLIDIEKDKRPSVKLIYKQFEKKESEYNSLMEKDTLELITPFKLTEIHKTVDYDTEGQSNKTKAGYCKCGSFLTQLRNVNYCDLCGQRLCWEESEVKNENKKA